MALEGVAGVPGADPPPQLRRNLPPRRFFLSFSPDGVPGIASLDTGSTRRGLPGVLAEREGEDGTGEPEEDVEVDDVRPETRRGRDIGRGNILVLLVAAAGTGAVGIVGVVGVT